jgi:hypothetical protein
MSADNMNRSPYGPSLGIFLAVFCGTSYAQLMQTPAHANARLAEDVRQAANRAQVTHDDGLTRSFARAAEQQPRAFMNAYQVVPSEARTQSMADYLTVKSQGNSSRSADLKDFHWGYIQQKVRFFPAKLEGTAASIAAIASVEMGGVKYDFGREGQQLGNVDTVALPAPQSGVEYVTVAFDVGKAKALWTGLADAGSVEVVRASSTAGCEIHVSSQPAGAKVYFNGKEWHRRTDTKSVRDPDEYEVLVRLPGFKDWQEKRKLAAGDSWVIKVRLKK